MNDNDVTARRNRLTRAQAHLAGCLLTHIARELRERRPAQIDLPLLAALVPRPRSHLVRYYGVLAPNARYRRRVVPGPPRTPAGSGEADEQPAPASGSRPVICQYSIDELRCLSMKETQSSASALATLVVSNCSSCIAFSSEKPASEGSRPALLPGGSQLS